MKKILIINSGSSSLKYQLFAVENNLFTVIAKGMAERIEIENSEVSISIDGGKKISKITPLPNHEIAIKEIFSLLLNGPLKSMEDLDAVGHRLGHGAEYFDKSVVIDDGVMDKIYETLDLLPLHGPAFVFGIKAISNILPNIKQIATFDTAFHRTMPKSSFLYALPPEQYEKHRIRRYGFHGTSHAYVSEEAAKLLGNYCKLITCHLGSGGSITAIENGKSIDTSLGFGAITGITMGTRCGELDPYIPLHIMKTQNKTPDEMIAMLSKNSGLFGLCGYSDTRDIEKAYKEGDEKAITAIEIYVHTVLKHIGAYIAVLGGVDAIIFTAGIGENSSFIRKKICEKLKYLGININDEANAIRGQNITISTPDSKIKVLVIPTNEELVIARDTYKLIST